MGTFEFFLDTCEVEKVRDAAKTGLISGVTTNPSLMKKAGLRDYSRVLEELCAIPVISHVSAQVREDQPATEMAIEGKNLSAICPEKIVVKVPFSHEGLRAIGLLKPAGIQTNVTLVFDPLQARRAMCAGADFVSMFVGRKAEKLTRSVIEEDAKREYRTDDLSMFSRAMEKRVEEWKNKGWVKKQTEDQIFAELALSVETRDILESKAKILAASLRNIHLAKQSFRCGADILTMPPDVFWEIHKKGIDWLYDDELHLTSEGTKQFLEDRKFLKS